jgi:hypothetical protein
VSEKSDLLQEAIAVVAQRGDHYGEVMADFTRIAGMWSDLYAAGREYEPHEVAMHMICIKLSRLVESPGQRDSWLDIAGYAACGWEAVVQMEKQNVAADRKKMMEDNT